MPSPNEPTGTGGHFLGYKGPPQKNSNALYGIPSVVHLTKKLP
jgi:hypothetical protein